VSDVYGTVGNHGFVLGGAGACSSPPPFRTMEFGIEQDENPVPQTPAPRHPAVAVVRVVRAGAVLAVLSAASPATAQTVLERVLARIAVSGLFVNAAQSGFGPLPQRIDASITNIFGDGRLPGADTLSALARPPATLTMGNLTALALGATNAGDLILSFAVILAAPADMPSVSVLPGVNPAMTVFFGENTSFQMQTDLAQFDDLVALSQRVSMQASQVGSGDGATVAALNLAANGGSINAGILNRIDGANLDAMDVTTTAIGAVNAGLARVVGGR